MREAPISLLEVVDKLEEKNEIIYHSNYLIEKPPKKKVGFTKYSREI